MQSVLARVVDCVAVTTRYPRQLLTPGADLENDLGIDSVKRVEIVAALADEFGLDLVTQERDPSIRTIQHVADWVANALEDGPASSSVPAVPTAASGPVPAPTSVQSAPPPVAAPLPPQVGNELPSRTYHANGSDATPQSGIPGGGLPPYVSVERRVDTVNPPNGMAPVTPLPQTSTLAGRVAFITGSGRGVGKTTARLLASRGATVIINSFHSRDQGEQTAADINAAGGNAIHIWGSVAHPDQVDEMFSQIQQRVGYLDMLICNASDGKIGSFSDVSSSDWDRAFRTNVSGHYQCAMHASRLMQQRGGGSIVTMSSIAAHKYVEGLGGQGVIKAAVESLTRYLACELAPLGIRTNCVSGGPVYGDLISMYPEASATHNYWENIIPDGQMCSPMDLASTIAFLLTDEARAINGAVWTVDHGASTRAHSRPLPQMAARNAVGSALN